MNKQKYTLLSILSNTFLALVVLVEVWLLEWPLAIITFGLLVTQVYLSAKHLMPRLFLLLFPLTVVVYILGGEHFFDLYRPDLYYDKVAHFSIEFTLTLLIGYLIKPKLAVKPWLFFLIVVSIGLMLGTVWEMFEWTYQFIIPPMLVTAGDTATDLMADSIGAIVAGWVIYKRRVKESE